MHDLAIETEKRKQSLFGLMNNHSTIELQTFCEYINNILAKSFIQLSKLLSSAPVLFIKRKDSRLRLCVDF